MCQLHMNKSLNVDENPVQKGYIAFLLKVAHRHHTLSNDALDAGTLKMNLASFDSSEKRSLENFHHWSTSHIIFLFNQQSWDPLSIFAALSHPQLSKMVAHSVAAAQWFFQSVLCLAVWVHVVSGPVYIVLGEQHLQLAQSS